MPTEKRKVDTLTGKDTVFKGQGERRIFMAFKLSWSTVWEDFCALIPAASELCSSGLGHYNFIIEHVNTEPTQETHWTSEYTMATTYINHWLKNTWDRSRTMKLDNIRNRYSPQCICTGPNHISTDPLWTPEINKAFLNGDRHVENVHIELNAQLRPMKAAKVNGLFAETAIYRGLFRHRAQER